MMASMTSITTNCIMFEERSVGVCCDVMRCGMRVRAVCSLRSAKELEDFSLKTPTAHPLITLQYTPLAMSAAASDSVPMTPAAAAAVDEWSSLRPLLSFPGPFCSPEFNPAEEDPLDIVQNSVRQYGNNSIQRLNTLMPGYVDIPFQMN